MAYLALHLSPTQGEKTPLEENGERRLLTEPDLTKHAKVPRVLLQAKP